MRRHILIREGAPRIQEIEKLEVLVHELAHYMGAAHSGNQNSVMRPVLGDGQSRARSFQILLDEPNAEIVRVVSEEMVRKNVSNMSQLSVGTQVRVRDQYLALAKESDDKVAPLYAKLMDRLIKASVEKREQLLRARKSREAARQKKNDMSAKVSEAAKQ